jgi:NO-binding membrane sensor protein with MHYT domain
MEYLLILVAASILSFGCIMMHFKTLNTVNDQIDSYYERLTYQKADRYKMASVAIIVGAFILIALLKLL